MNKIDIRKWNYETHEYDAYTPPEGWVPVLVTDDMELAIKCASCGKDMDFGSGYTSKELHTTVGFGYPVCEDCYEKESERDRDDRRREA